MSPTRAAGPRPGTTMRVGRCAALALLALLGVGARPSAERILATEPPELVERLERDRLLLLEEVEGEASDAFAVAFIVFQRSRSEVVGLLRQAERQREYRQELDRVRTVRRLENGRIDEQQIKIMFRKLVYRVRYHEDPVTGRLEWKLDPDFENDLDRFEGFWELYEFEDGRRTLGRFGSSVDVGGVPQGIQRRLSRKTVARYLENCQKWIDSDGTWRP